MSTVCDDEAEEVQLREEMARPLSSRSLLVLEPLPSSLPSARHADTRVEDIGQTLPDDYSAGNWS